MTSRYTSTSNQEITWAEVDTKTSDIYIDNTNVDQSRTFIDVGEMDDKDGAAFNVLLQPTTLYTLNLTHVPIKFYGHQIYKDFGTLYGIGFWNQSNKTIYVGSSGVVSAVSFIGYSTPLGPSGLYHKDIPLGVHTSDYGTSIGIYNPNSTSVICQISLLGQYGVTLPTMPSTSYLRAIVNANQGILGYGPYVISEAFITDINNIITFETAAGPLSGVLYPDTLEWVANNVGGSPLIGSYFSSSRVNPQAYMELFPNECPPAEDWTDEELSDITIENPTYFPPVVETFVDLTQQSVRDKFANYIVDAALERKNTYGLNFIFLDNWCVTAGCQIDEDTTMLYMRQVRDRLHALGIRMCANCAIVPGDPNLPRSTFTTLGQSTDSISLEAGLFGTITSNATYLSYLLQDYQNIIAGGCLPILLADPAQDLLAGTTDEKILRESRLSAAFCLCFPGTMTALSYFYPRQDWFTWPTDFGPVTGPVTQVGTTISRARQNFTIHIDFSTRTISSG